MKEFGYDPIQFGKINFSLGTLKEEDLQMKWLCHHDGDTFAHGLSNGEKSIVSTGFGMSGVPHAGTVSVILRSIALQRAGVPVNMVLGDLDAYNGKGRPLKGTLELAEKYKNFALNLGFDNKPPSILRSQYNACDVLRTSYITGHYMDDNMFNNAEEDLHDFYSQHGKVDNNMSYRRKLSLNLMTADFINLHTDLNFKNVLVMLGIDEHKYVQFARETINRMKTDENAEKIDMTIGGLYSSMNKGFCGYPKMSKSFPESSLSVDMSKDAIYSKIMNEPQGKIPENDVVYQLMASASYYSPKELREKYDAFQSRGKSYIRI
jgi:tryptophanyl-tRNA synthetase